MKPETIIGERTNMDKYEQILEEKIEYAKKSLEAAEREFRFGALSEQKYLKIKQCLDDEIRAYQDALVAYRNLKAKGESRMGKYEPFLTNRIESYAFRLDTSYISVINAYQDALNTYMAMKEKEEI